MAVYQDCLGPRSFCSKQDSGKKTLSVRRRLILLLTVMIMPFIAFSAYNAVYNYKQLEAQHQQSSLVLAKELAAVIDEYITSTGELLISIATNDAVRNRDYATVRKYFQDIWPNYPFYSNIIFVDMNGDIQAAGRQKLKGAGQEDGKAVSVSDTVYFERAMRTNTISVGDFMYGKISGAPVVHVTHPVFDGGKNRAGFVAAAFDLSKLQNRIMHARVPPNTVVAVFDKKGITIARNINPEEWVGKDLSKHMDFEQMLDQREGVGKVLSPDGVTRVFAFAATDKVPWYVRVGVDSNRIGHEIRKELLYHFAVFFPLLLVALTGWIWIGRDVNSLHKETERLSLVDPLTELWNCRKLSQDLELEFNRVKRNGQQISFAMIDIDHFKQYNDAHGHQLGNAALSAVAHIIVSAVRVADSVYRCGGEEMCVLFRDADKEGAMKASERMRREIEEAHFAGEETQPLGKLTISVGVATYPKDAVSKEGLLQNADLAMYRAKKAGRNLVKDFCEQDANPDSPTFQA